MDALDPLLRVDDLTTVFDTNSGPLTAVDRVSFEIRRGETLGLVGESGCGKTTTAKMILRLEHPTAGTVTVDGHDVHALTGESLRQYRAKVQAVFQDPWSSLPPRMRVREIVAEPLVINGLASSHEIKERVAEILAAVGLRPQQATNLGLIFITHDFGIVAKMCDRVMVMYAGRAVETGSVRDIFNRPSHPYTQALLNSVPSMDDDIARLYSIAGQPPALWDLPEGCRFAPRCPHADDRCRHEYPRAFSVGEGHTADCWRLEKEWTPRPFSASTD